MAALHFPDGIGRAADHSGRIFEAALVDGANRLQIFFYITLPFITPILVISACFA